MNNHSYHRLLSVAAVARRQILILILILSTSTSIIGTNAQTTPAISTSPSMGCNTCALGTSLLNTGPPCDALARQTSGLFETDTDCKDLQLELYQKGCCSMPSPEYCSYCKDANAVPNLDLIIPTGQYVKGISCFDYYYQAESRIGMFRDGDCSDTFLQRAGHYCGCPNQVQECFLCPDGKPPNKPAASDAWVTRATCRGVEYMFSLFNQEECASFPLTVGADLAIFCGCGGLNQTEIDEHAATYTCSLCENGGNVTDRNFVYTNGATNGNGNINENGFSKTCGQAEDFARAVIKTPSGCRDPRHFEVARANCACSGGNNTSTSGAAGFGSVVNGSGVSISVSAVLLLGTTVGLLLAGTVAVAL